MNIVLKFIIFAVITIVSILLHRKALTNYKSHGFFRFFVFECILALLLLNTEFWFYKPFSLFQIISWLLLILSLAIAVHGFYLLHEMGKPKRGIEDTTVLVRRGIFRLIRHPLYFSLILLELGVFLKNPSLVGIVLVIVVFILLFLAARYEEKENIQRFGAEYQAYMKTTKMFIPFVI